MSEPEVVLADVIIDCADPAALAAFWAELLGRPVEGSKGPYVWLHRPEGAIGFGFQRVSEPKVAKNRVHVDVAAVDVVAATLRIEAIGGHRLAGFEGGGFLVMADPEGNEFCVVPSAPFHFDDEGRADYLDSSDF